MLVEDVRIADIAREWGAEVIDRPIELSQDEAPEWLAWQHAIKHVQENIGDFEKFVF